MLTGRTRIASGSGNSPRRPWRRLVESVPAAGLPTAAPRPRRPHAGFPQGFLTTTNSIDRIVKESTLPMSPAGATTLKVIRIGQLYR